MAYCSVNRVRLVSGLDSHEISDDKIRDLRDEIATPEMNQDIIQKKEDERVDRRISKEKQNRTDGENEIFYLRETHNNELQVGDKNNDGLVDESDLDFHFIDSEDNRTSNFSKELLDREIGKIQLTNEDGSPLDNGELYVSYVASPVNQNGYENRNFQTGDGPDRLVETACAQLTAAYSFTNVEASKLKDFSIGNVTINSQSEGASIMREDYRNTLRRITQTQVAQSGENENTVMGAFR